MKVVRPVESTRETQPQLQPALLRLSAMISQDFIRSLLCLFARLKGNKRPNDGTIAPSATAARVSSFFIRRYAPSLSRGRLGPQLPEAACDPRRCTVPGRGRR